MSTSRNPNFQKKLELFCARGKHVETRSVGARVCVCASVVLHGRRHADVSRRHSCAFYYDASAHRIDAAGQSHHRAVNHPVNMSGSRIHDELFVDGERCARPPAPVAVGRWTPTSHRPPLRSDRQPLFHRDVPLVKVDVGVLRLHPGVDGARRVDRHARPRRGASAGEHDP
jgi:hypothetical protein